MATNGIRRFGHAYVPLDDAVGVVIDFPAARGSLPGEFTRC
jgi:imidazoleglycerol phosphate dehydratase HisB